MEKNVKNWLMKHIEKLNKETQMKVVKEVRRLEEEQNDKNKK